MSNAGLQFNLLQLKDNLSKIIEESQKERIQSFINEQNSELGLQPVLAQQEKISRSTRNKQVKKMDQVA